MRVHFLILSVLLMCAGCGGGGGGSSSGGEGTSGGFAQFSGSCALRITNGDTCSAGPGPVALIVIEDASGTPIGICTGAFISPTAVLSAAHCFSGQGANVVVEVQGANVPVAEIDIPREYVPSENNLSVWDFSVLKLASAIDGVETLPILTSEQLQKGSTINIVGFGVDEHGSAVFEGKDFSNGLRKGTMVVADIDTNEGIFSALFSPTNQSVCSGDSGGPAIGLNRDGKPGIVGIAQAISGRALNASDVSCLDGSTSYFALAQNTNLLNKLQTIVPDLNLL